MTLIRSLFRGLPFLKTLYISAALALAISLVACQPQAPVFAPPKDKPGILRSKPSPQENRTGLNTASLVGLDGASLIGLDGASLIGLDGASLIGLDGASLIGLDGASIQAQLTVPSSLIGLDGASLIGLDGASYKLRQASSPEKPFAGISVYLRTADGRFIVDDAKKLLVAKTDANGNVYFRNLKANAALFFYVPIGQRGSDIYGLAGLRTADHPGPDPTPINAASSMLCTWLENDVIAGLDAKVDKAERLNRLPHHLAEDTLTGIKNTLATPPDFKKLTRVDITNEIKSLESQANSGLAEKLETVRYTIAPLAGTDSCRDGLSARRVALRLPRAVAATPDGALFVCEAFSGMVYRIDPDGRRWFVLGPCVQEDQRLFAPDIEHFSAANGWLYLVPNRGRSVLRVSTDGANMQTLIGTGTGTLTAGALGTSVALYRPGPATPALDGNLWVTDGRFGTDLEPPRIFKVDSQGRILQIHSTPWDDNPKAFDTRFIGFAETQEGLWVYAIHGSRGLYFQPHQGAWRKLNVQIPEKMSNIATLLAMPDQTVLLTLADEARERHVIERIWSDGRMERFAGQGQTGVDEGSVQALSARFNTPTGLALAPDGRVIVTDYDNGLLRAINPETKEVTIIAGNRGSQDIVALSETLNNPLGLAVNKQGDIYVSEYGAHSIRRLNGDRLERIAGGVAGIATDGTLPDRLMGPSNIAFAGDELVIMEATARLVRRIRNIANPAEAQIETLAGKLEGAKMGILPSLETLVPAREQRFEEIGPVTVDPEGRVIFASMKHPTLESKEAMSDCIWRIETNGTLTRLVGSSNSAHPDDDTRDGKRGTEVRLHRPTAMACDKRGNLYFTDLRSLQVLKLDRENIVHIVAGSGFAKTLVSVANGKAATEQDIPATEASLLLPSGLAVAPDDTLYLSELGSAGKVSMTHEELQGINLDNLPKIPGRIRKLASDGHLKTLAGSGAPGGPGDTQGPASLAIAPNGRLVYIDLVKSQIQELQLQP
ncbi:MAG: hypothetical protein VKN33_05905 [Candidatus Sericytochromatia bacterium]|nr:hypothetical protein [Candidatus Sericytochromatia bacterium]